MFVALEFANILRRKAWISVNELKYCDSGLFDKTWRFLRASIDTSFKALWYVSPPPFLLRNC